MATTQDAFGPLSIVRDATTGTQLAITNKEGTVVAGPDARYTAAQLSALAAAGGLTPNATYVASDTGRIGRATSASVLQYEVAAAGRLRVAFIGDSFVQLSGQMGLAVTMGTVINGLTTNGTPRAPFDTPTGGTGLLTFDGVRYASYHAYGEADGPTVDLSDGGVRRLYSAGGTWLELYVLPRAFDGVPRTSTTTLSTASWQRSGMPYLVDALTGGRMTVGRFGVGGSYSTDVAVRRQQVLDWLPDVIVDTYGTNDVAAAGLSGAAAVANRVANWDAWTQAGVRVIATTVPARWAAADAGSRTDAKQEALVRYNDLMRQAADSRPYVTVVDWYGGTVDPASATGTAIATLLSSDGLHPDGGANYVAARQIAAVLNGMIGPASGFGPVGANAGYDAADNPSGQLITSSRGSFVGTGGTAGTGTSAAAAWGAGAYAAGAVIVNATVGVAYYTPNGGTSSGATPTHRAGTVADGGGVLWTAITEGASIGWAAGWNGSRSGGASATASYYKVVDPDGGTPWQEMFVANPTPEAHTFFLYPPTLSMGNISTGDYIEGGIEIDVLGRVFTGLQFDLNVIGGAAAGSQTGSAVQVKNIVQGFQGRAVIRSEPFQVPASTTSMQPRLFILGGNATEHSFYRVRMRNMFWRKVV